MSQWWVHSFGTWAVLAGFCRRWGRGMAASKTLMDLFYPAKRQKKISSFFSSSSSSSSVTSPSTSSKTFLSNPKRTSTSTSTSTSSSSSPCKLADLDTICNATPSSPSASASASLTEDQKLRVEFNKLHAKSKRNLRICLDRVSKSTSDEMGFVRLEQLLVETTWLEAIPGELQKPYAEELCKFVQREILGDSSSRGQGSGVPIYPPVHLIFNALNTTPFDRVKAVIIGQDPYHGPGQAMGLAFSVPEGIKVPSSLLNIYKELQQDLCCSVPSHGNLERWAVQGVLLVNAVLTVRQHQANSHAKKGWEQFTDAVIKAISLKKKGVVFLLWGNYAHAKTRLIDETKHHILKAAHPSGLSANRGFFGCRHFSRTNKLLDQMGISQIDWQL